MSTKKTNTVTIDASVHTKLKREADRKGMKIAKLAERLILSGIKK